MTLCIDHFGWHQDGPWPSKWSQNGPFHRFSWRNQPIMGAHSVQMASNEKPNMSESLGGNNLTYWPFRMTSGWSMTLKMEPNWPFFRFSWRNQLIMGAQSLQMASNEKPNMSESLRGNYLTYWPFRMMSGWSMTLKLEPKWTTLQVFLEPLASKLPFFWYISTLTAAKIVLTRSGWHVITLGTPGVAYLWI